jgi:hypothetical protein
MMTNVKCQTLIAPVHAYLALGFFVCTGKQAAMPLGPSSGFMRNLSEALSH